MFSKLKQKTQEERSLASATAKKARVSLNHADTHWCSVDTEVVFNSLHTNSYPVKLCLLVVCTRS